MARDILDIASALRDMYLSVFGLSEEESDLTEMKMHKLLYFAQKIHYKHFGEWLFDDEFEGWIHGPVNRKVRAVFMYLPPFDGELTPEEEYTLREVIYDYGRYTAGYLRNLSHQETAYKISREGLREDEPGNRVISKNDMILDMFESDDDALFEDCEVH
jgi:uncharacterized phage-associated protein